MSESMALLPASWSALFICTRNLVRHDVTEKVKAVGVVGGGCEKGLMGGVGGSGFDGGGGEGGGRKEWVEVGLMEEWLWMGLMRKGWVRVEFDGGKEEKGRL